jgi:hypothetical protein
VIASDGFAEGASFLDGGASSGEDCSVPVLIVSFCLLSTTLLTIRNHPSTFQRHIGIDSCERQWFDLLAKLIAFEDVGRNPQWN